MSLYAIESKCFEEDDKQIIWTNRRREILNVCTRNTIRLLVKNTIYKCGNEYYELYRTSLLLYGIWVTNNLKVIEK